MAIRNLSEPLVVPVNPPLLMHATEGKNLLVQAGLAAATIEILSFERKRSYLQVNTVLYGSISILTKKAQYVEGHYLIRSDSKTLSLLEDALLSGNVTLTWVRFNSNAVPDALLRLDGATNVQLCLNHNVYLNEEQRNELGRIIKEGLRPPQIGSIYSILSHWATSTDIATVVLPTGTGKSETILSTIAYKAMYKALIIVPSDGLRSQFFENAKHWGILRLLKVIGDDVPNPVVLKLAASPEQEDLFVAMIQAANIIIATTALLHSLKEKFKIILAEQCEAIFVDEAHHSAAPTWQQLNEQFHANRIIQFTATPFREDNQPIKGKIIFDFPLAQAQKHRYFTKIDFVPVVDYDKENWDRTIAEKAISVLRKDIEEGADHILMARVDNIIKARQIYEKYYRHLTEFNPILITSKSGNALQLIERLRRRESRIVVCVNMLGEGIDLPQMKIAALHDIRKSLTITLQFIGRFTRSSKSDKPAKIIANIADVTIEKKLEQLYKEDADWGKIIAFASAQEIQRKIKLQQVLTNFKDSKIPLLNLKPKLSTTVYKVDPSQFNYAAVTTYFDQKEGLYVSDYSEQDSLIIVIYQTRESIDWLPSNDFNTLTWELLIYYLDRERGLLYVNSSLKAIDLDLLKALTRVQYRFEKEYPFKVYADMNYVVLYSMGLDKYTDGPVRYAMYVGSDVFDGISYLERKASGKSNTYGSGYVKGEEQTLGASKNGKIWSRRIGNISDWKDWCDTVGNKLLDDTINVNEIFKGFLQPRKISLADLSGLALPTSIDWPTSYYQSYESIQSLIFDDTPYSINEIDLFVRKEGDDFIVEFRVESFTYILALRIDADYFQWLPLNFKRVDYQRKSTIKDFLEELQTEDTFRIRLQDNTFLENNYHFKPYANEELFSLPLELLTGISWDGVHTNVESMGFEPPFITDSVQYKIYSLKATNPDFTIIINDDDAGEAGDLLCFGVVDDKLIVEIIHCKYKVVSDPVGSRAKDFYELCCQAQKVLKSFSNLNRLYDHLRSREVKKVSKGETRFLKGDLRQLELLIKSTSYRKPRFKVILVQPALSVRGVTAPVLELLGATYTLLHETLHADFEVICHD